jgi:Protein of unknown function (DUF3716)
MPARATSMPPFRPALSSSTSAREALTSVPEASGSSTVPARAPTSAPTSTPTPAPTPAQVESPLALAARAESLPPKASATLQALAKLPRVRGVELKAERTIVWERIVNHEAVLGYTRGEGASEACVSCKRRSGPFVACVLVPNMLLGACTNCHYGSGSCRCSFREYFLIIIFISDCLQVKIHLQAL